MTLEFYKRLGKKIHFHPDEAEAMYLTMLEEVGVEVLFESRLDSVSMEEGVIRAIQLESGEQVLANIYVDATYEGDLYAAAGVSYTVGREPRGAYNESLAGQWQEISWLNTYQFCRLPISPFVDPNDPTSGLLPEISSEPFGAPGEGDNKVQAYNFRMRLTSSADRLPYPKPDGYDPNRYALLARFINEGVDVEWKFNYTQEAMTDGPVQLREGDNNNAGSFSTDYVGGSNLWPDGTYAPGSFATMPAPRRGLPMPMKELYTIRESIFQDHVNYQQGLMYFLANDPQVPDSIREKMNTYGLNPDAFQDTGHWPHQLYIREGRRMVSDYVMNQAHCDHKVKAEDSIGLASYAMDSHFCQRVVVEENGVTTVRNEGGFGHHCAGPYPVAYRAIVPKAEECTNLLVPVCLSASHVAYGSIRMEPVFMILGESAGTAAVMAIDRNIPVQQVPYAELRGKLLEQGQRLDY